MKASKMTYRLLHNDVLSRESQAYPGAYAGRASVCCTGCRLTASWEGETFRLDTVGWCIKLGRLIALNAGGFTREVSGSVMSRSDN